MEGYPEQLVKNAYDFIDDRVLRNCLGKLLVAVLGNQFVKLENGECYQVAKGSGMGQVVSGEAADKKLYVLAERERFRV